MIDDDVHELRLQTVIARLSSAGARSVLDLGCGPGELLTRLAEYPQFERITGIDIAVSVLAEARQRLGLLAHGAGQRVDLLLASFAVADSVLAGFDAGVMLETIEHVDPEQLAVVERAVFGTFRPRLLLVTTPNAEYNRIYGMAPGQVRHPGHRFEWPRARFRRWCTGVAQRNQYTVRFDDIGEYDPDCGASTQMATFTRVDADECDSGSCR